MAERLIQTGSIVTAPSTPNRLIVSRQRPVVEVYVAGDLFPDASTPGPTIPALVATLVTGVSRILVLGPLTDDHGFITYASTGLTVTGNRAVFSSNSAGVQNISYTATSANGGVTVTTAVLALISNPTEYSLTGVVVDTTEHSIDNVQVL